MCAETREREGVGWGQNLWDKATNSEQVVNKVRNGQKMELTRAFFPSSHRCARACVRARWLRLVSPTSLGSPELSCGAQWVAAAAAITHFMSSRSVAYFISKRGLLNLRLIILVTLFFSHAKYVWLEETSLVELQRTHFLAHVKFVVCSIYFSATYYNL